jgi:hypothetical protein
MHMAISKRVVLTGLTGAAAGFSTAAFAQMSQSKSQGLGKLGEDEAIRVHPVTGTIQKSNIKVPVERHEAAMARGHAKEIPSNAIFYKHAGKMYMFDAQAAANNQAAIDFESQFDNE